MYEGPNGAHGNCLQLWNQVVRDTYKSDITAQAWSGIKGAGGAALRTVTMVNVQLSCRSHTPYKLHLTWETKGDIWTALALELFTQDSALAFTAAAVAFSLLSRRFYGVQPFKSTLALPILPNTLCSSSSKYGRNNLISWEPICFHWHFFL